MMFNLLIQLKNGMENPFSGKVDGNVIFGRGSSDDKGELITSKSC